jgi:hypothetical protein
VCRILMVGFSPANICSAIYRVDFGVTRASGPFAGKNAVPAISDVVNLLGKGTEMV